VKTWQVLLASAVLATTLVGASLQKPAGADVPKYDKSTEATFKGTEEEVRDHPCPVSRGTGSHLMLKQPDGTVIEVHLALTKFVNQYELVFQKGDVLEVTGVKVHFQTVDTIFARKVKRGNDEFLFRDNDGKPLW
jgi:DNA/RNA endonuclease YhcR with UshA esterase domain